MSNLSSRNIRQAFHPTYCLPRHISGRLQPVYVPIDCWSYNAWCPRVDNDCPNHTHNHSLSADVN